MTTPDYSFQDRAIEQIAERRASGVKRLCATGPTGCGKGNIIVRLFQDELEAGGRPIVYTDRRIVRQQLQDRLHAFGVDHGVRASGVRPDHSAPAQVSSIGTERTRSLNPDHHWRVFDATLVLVDEWHANKADTAQRLLDAHGDAFICGLTATPVGLGFKYGEQARRFCDEILTIATHSEMFEAGVLVKAEVFAPSEIDATDMKLDANGDFVRKHVQERFQVVKHAIFGNVVDWIYKLNPELYGIAMFPPGVPESRWLVGQLNQEGISAVHLDADTEDSVRDAAFREHEEGSLSVISSFGILTTGWDAPWAKHCVLLRQTSSVQTYLQIVGRVMRAYPGKDKAILQDHVGAWWRPGLGSPNVDRDWQLDDTAKSISARVKRQREFPEFDKELQNQEPVRCKKCSRPLPFRASGDYVCPKCATKFKMSQRVVVQLDGTLKKMVGRATKKKSPRDDNYFYRKAVYAGVHGNLTVGQVYGLACKFKNEHLQTTDARIDRRAVTLFKIPAPETSEWHMRASRLYYWISAKPKSETAKPF